MQTFIQILVSLIGGGVITLLITLFVNRRIRKKDGVEALSQTIDFLVDKNVHLIQTEVQLRQEIAYLKSQRPFNRSERRRMKYCSPKKTRIPKSPIIPEENEETENKTDSLLSDDDEPP